jgi:hypothetical protein
MSGNERGSKERATLVYFNATTYTTIMDLPFSLFFDKLYEYDQAWAYDYQLKI